MGWTPKLNVSLASTSEEFVILIPCLDADEITSMIENNKALPTTKATDNEAKVKGREENAVK